jgi:hypothetical protein
MPWVDDCPWFFDPHASTSGDWVLTSCLLFFSSRRSPFLSGLFILTGRRILIIISITVDRLVAIFHGCCDRSMGNTGVFRTSSPHHLHPSSFLIVRFSERRLLLSISVAVLVGTGRAIVVATVLFVCAVCLILFGGWLC